MAAGAGAGIWAHVPNFLTSLRVALAGLFPLVPESWRVPIVVLAGVSDGLDGWVARRFHATSEAGRLPDGIADKAFVLAAVGTLVVEGRVPWWAGLLVMARDVVVGVLALVLALRRAWSAFRRMRPRLLGKWTTAFAFAWFACLLLDLPEALRWTTFALAAASSVGAAVDYARQARGFRDAR